jgi:hypothetical protein
VSPEHSTDFGGQLLVAVFPISMPSGASGTIGYSSKVNRLSTPSGSALSRRSASSTDSTLIRKITPTPFSRIQNCSILPSRYNCKVAGTSVGM